MWTEWPNFPTRNIKVSSKKQMNLLPVTGYIKVASQTQTAGPVKFGSLDHGNSAGNLTSLFKWSLSLNSHSWFRAARPQTEITPLPSRRGTSTFCSTHALWNNNYQLWKLKEGTPSVRMQGLWFLPKNHTYCMLADGKAYVRARHEYTQTPTHTEKQAIFPWSASGCSWEKKKVKCAW